MDALEVAGGLAALGVGAAAGLVIRVRRAEAALLAHPHVERLEVALPVHAPFVRALVEELAGLAGVRAPEVFVYRAQLPNAFVLDVSRRPMLFLADRALEAANAAGDGALEALAALVAHELAHLKLRQTWRHFWLWWLARARLPGAARALARLEAKADAEAQAILAAFARQAARNT